MDLATPRAHARGPLPEQFGREAKHLGGDRATLFFVGRQQRVWRTAQHRGQLPAEVVGVLDVVFRPCAPAGGWV